jgi:UDP-N-acetylglucosamine diphosphorylase / glucose-1-phosphate thymidylyltransferase / UDP-N-acetylgalactosamine diphosphorylase / glucosamine-1-phosphate N-acetyltransferase / galactosamine-1-phosphate N-acetyltransferase
MPLLHPAYYFDLSAPGVARLFDGVDLVWDILASFDRVVNEMVGERRVINGTVMDGAYIDEGPLYIAKGAVLEPGTYVKGPAYIGPGVVIRHGAYIRGDVVMLEASVLGHASEAKKALFLPGAQAPHFAYVGDSVLGHRANLGAGTKLSNAVLAGRPHPGAERKSIELEVGSETIDTGLAKFGAIIGDDVEIGCNAVLSPGTLVGPRAMVYPNATLTKGVYPADTIIKVRQAQSCVERK